MAEPLEDAIQAFYKKRGVKVDEPASVDEIIEAAPEIEDKPKETYAPSAKRLFPLKNKYLTTIRSLNAKGRKSQAKLLQENHEARLQNAAARKWKIRGKEVDRYTMMKWVVEQMAAGQLISDICNGKDGMPSLQTVFAWQNEHPEFKKAVKLAKEIQAQVFADEALQGVRKAEVSEAKLVKVQHDALMKRAALQSDEFKDKQVIQQETKTTSDPKELEQQLLAILRSDPDLANIVKRELGADAIPALAAPEHEQDEAPSERPQFDEPEDYDE